LNDDEMAECRAAWGGPISISYDERVLGIRLGIDADIERQYVAAVEKAEGVLQLLQAHRADMSLATRIQAVNIFVYSIFGYLNRHFWMPRKMVDRIETQVLKFLTPIPWARLRFFTAAAEIYGTRTTLIDLRLTNAAQLLVVGHLDGIDDANAAVLARWRTGLRRLVNPALSWWTAVEFFKATTGESHVAVWRKRHGGMSEKMGLNGQRFFYTALRKAEAKHWSKYLRDRVQAKG